jgi:hypothetical protein
MSTSFIQEKIIVISFLTGPSIFVYAFLYYREPKHVFEKQNTRNKILIGSIISLLLLGLFMPRLSLY